MAQEGNHEVDRFSSRIAPIAQLVTLAVLTIVVLVWNDALVTENTKQEARLGQLELQVHALALSTPAPSTVAPQVSENAISPNVGLQTNGGTPMQQACANLIGRVADAYEKGESSKIALSLEELVQKLGCHNTPTP